MLRRLTSFGIGALGLLCMAIKPHTPPASPPPAPVPTAKKVTTTAPAAPTAAAPVPVPAAPVPTPPAPNTVERARQGVVVVERQGKPLALGTVLEGDGRVLSALSSLGNGNFLNVRYADGVVVPLKLVHSDRGWDLALLSPVATATQARRTSGLRAAKTPSFVGLQLAGLAPPHTVTLAPTALKLSPGLLGGDATALVGAYELDRKPALVGGPVLNAEGEVVATVARACPAGGNTPCVPAPYGAPVSALKQFLQRVPAEASWLGIEAASSDSERVRGVRVASVVANSPAAVAGLRAGKDSGQADVIVAVEGTPVSTPQELNEAVRAYRAGDSVELLLFGLGRYRSVSVKPGPAPRLTAPPASAPKATPPAPNPSR